MPSLFFRFNRRYLGVTGNKMGIADEKDIPVLSTISEGIAELLFDVNIIVGGARPVNNPRAPGLVLPL